MPIDVDPFSSSSSGGYLSSSDDDFDDIVASCPEITSDFLAADNLDAWLLRASERIDVGGPYQGRKYDPTQALEFPRIARGPLIGPVIPILPPPDAALLRNGMALDEPLIWDWDYDSSSAIVPDRVKRACLYEAFSLWQGSRAERMDAQHDGIASQAVGNASESYRATGGIKVLSRSAAELMAYYRLRSGAMI